MSKSMSNFSKSMSNFPKTVSNKVSNFSKKVSNLADEQKEKLLKKIMKLSSSNKYENENKIWNPQNNYRPNNFSPNQLWESNNNNKVNNKVKKVPNNSKINNTEVSKNKVNKLNNSKVSNAKVSNAKVSNAKVSKNIKDKTNTANEYINQEISRKIYSSKNQKIKKQITKINEKGNIIISFTVNSQKKKELKKSIFNSFPDIKANSILTENQKKSINKVINKKYNELPAGNSNILNRAFKK